MDFALFSPTPKNAKPDCNVNIYKTITKLRYRSNFRNDVKL